MSNARQMIWCNFGLAFVQLPMAKGNLPAGSSGLIKISREHPNLLISLSKDSRFKEVISTTKDRRSLQCNHRCFIIQVINKSKFMAYYSTISGNGFNSKCHNNNLSWDTAACSDNQFMRIAFILHLQSSHFCFWSGTWERDKIVSCGADFTCQLPHMFPHKIKTLNHVYE